MKFQFDELIDLVNEMYSSCNYRQRNNQLVSQLYFFWIDFIKNNNFASLIDSKLSGSVEFPLEHFRNNTKYTMSFDIEHVLKYIDKKDIAYMIKPLSDVYTYIHYTNMENTYWDKNALSSPIVAVPMPSIKDGIFYRYEIIDGNHRITYAFNNKKNIPVHLIVEVVLPPTFFLFPESWIKYHILSSFYFIAQDMLNNPISYISELEKSMNYYVFS